MDIRLMTDADYPAAHALWESTPWACNGLVPADDGAGGIARFLARNPTTCFVAEEEGALLGTILCGHDGRRAMVYHMCVLPSARGRGLGRRLWDAAAGTLRAAGIRKASLTCFKENTGGNAFWQSLGWQKREDLNFYGFVQ